MNTKDIKKMAILDQALMQKAENGKFIVSEDYNLNPTLTPLNNFS